MKHRSANQEDESEAELGKHKGSEGYAPSMRVTDGVCGWVDLVKELGHSG